MPEARDIITSDTDNIELKSINPFEIGGGFLDYCMKHGWIIRKGTARNGKYYVTGEGIEALKKFGIKIR
jgi:hypothetical protein